MIHLRRSSLRSIYPEVYRYVLRQQQCQIVSLKEELDFLDSYIFLHQVRLGDCLSLECDLPDNVIDHQLPPLTLQLLAENVVKHNYIDDFNPMTIRVYTEKERSISMRQQYITT